MAVKRQDRGKVSPKMTGQKYSQLGNCNPELARKYGHDPPFPLLSQVQNTAKVGT